MARREAAFCEEAANQRWYRVNYALCPKGQGAFSMDSITQTERLRRQGTRFVFYAAVLYSIGGLCIKVIPWNAMSINSGRNILSMLVIGLFLRLTHHPLRFNRRIALGAISVCGTNTLYALANKLTTAANAIVLQYTAPVFVILLSLLFWRKKPDRLDLAACGIVLCGVV